MSNPCLSCQVGWRHSFDSTKKNSYYFSSLNHRQKDFSKKRVEICGQIYSSPLERIGNPSSTIHYYLLLTEEEDEDEDKGVLNLLFFIFSSGWIHNSILFQYYAYSLFIPSVIQVFVSPQLNNNTSLSKRARICWKRK